MEIKVYKTCKTSVDIDIKSTLKKLLKENSDIICNGLIDDFTLNINEYISDLKDDDEISEDSIDSLREELESEFLKLVEKC